MGNKAEATPSPPINTTQWMWAIALTLRLLAIARFASVLWFINIIDGASSTSSQAESQVQVIESKVNISNFLSFRYMLGCAVIGIIFTILLLNLSISQLAFPDQQIKGSLAQKYWLYNEIMLIVVASGGAASMGFTLELSRLQDEVLSKIVSTSILNSMHLVSGTYLIGFLSNFVSSVLVRIAPLW